MPHYLRINRDGATLPLMAIMLPVFVIFLAISMDLTKIYLVKNQLQIAADAGSLSGAAVLCQTDSNLQTLTFSLEAVNTDDVYQNVNEVVGSNYCAHLTPEAASSLSVTPNNENHVDGEVVIGTYSGNEFVPELSFADCVKVSVRLSNDNQNGRLPLVFGNILNFVDINLEATAIAKVERHTILPFILYDPIWQALEAGSGDDLFTVTDGLVSSGPDGILETVALPGDWNGSGLPPGNFGWIDLGSDTGTDTIRDLIDRGPTTADMEVFGGSLQAGDMVGGITGFRAGAEIALLGGEGGGVIYEGVLGKPRFVALFDQALGEGNNATFRITRFVLVRVVSANLSNNPKEIRIQPVTDEANRARLME